MVEFKGSKVLVPAVGGAIGGVLVIIIFLALVILLIIAKCRTRPELKPNSEDIEMKENEIYGVSMATVQAGQPQMQYNALMSGYVCYATTQHMEIVDNECYGSVPEK